MTTQPTTAKRPLTTLEKLAMEVAICAPSRQTRYTTEARIPWTIIDRIREEAARHGIDWKALRRDMERIQAERREAIQAAKEQHP